MRRIANQSITNNIWSVEGLTYQETIKQEYANCCFSAGFVEGAEPDTMYLKLERDGNVDLFLLLRPDEVAIIGWLMTGILWSNHMETLPIDDGVS